MELVGLYLNKDPIAFDEGCMPAFAEWQRWLGHKRLLMLLRTGSNFSRITVGEDSVVHTTETQPYREQRLA